MLFLYMVDFGCHDNINFEQIICIFFFFFFYVFFCIVRCLGYLEFVKIVNINFC